MKVAGLIIAGVLFVAGGLFAELPKEGSELLSKLEAWEMEQRIALEWEVQKKKKAVADALEKQMKEITKRGDLDLALEYKKEIERLRAESAEPPKDPSKPAPLTTEPAKRLTPNERAALAKAIEGDWKHWKGTGYFTFRTGRFWYQDWSAEAVVQSDGTILVKHPTLGGTAVLSLDPEKAALVGKNFGGEDVTIERWKK